MSFTDFPSQEGEKIGDDASNETVDPRRERNRVLARETRMRKKNMMSALKDKVSVLVKDNERLKAIVQTRLERPLADKVLLECCGSLPDVVATMSNKATAILTREDYGLIAAIRAAQRAFCISDPHLPDNPIVFASQGFLELTGYSMDQVINRNCRFLQGPDTDMKSVAVLAEGVRQGVDTSVPLLNYKADGTPFWNQIYVAALKDSNNVIVNYVGVQCEIDDPNISGPPKMIPRVTSLSAVGTEGFYEENDHDDDEALSDEDNGHEEHKSKKIRTES